MGWRDTLWWLKVQTAPTWKWPRLSSQHTYEAAQNSVIAAPGDPTPSLPPWTPVLTCTYSSQGTHTYT